MTKMVLRVCLAIGIATLAFVGASRATACDPSGQVQCTTAGCNTLATQDACEACCETTEAAAEKACGAKPKGDSKTWRACIEAAGKAEDSCESTCEKLPNGGDSDDDNN